uniref:Uncharacterized protein n=2 Tax=Lygus hesperus TaxID=30085 RepID=A0A0K8T030_LYGHE
MTSLYNWTPTVKFSPFYDMEKFVSLLCRVNSNEPIDVNGVVDKLLDSIRQLAIDHDMDEMPVPEVHEEWEETRGILRLKGCINCTNGRLRSLTSIQRTGDANLSKRGDHLVLKVLLGFCELELEYEKCQATLHRLSVTSGLRASVQSNSVDAEIKIRISGGELKATISHIFLAEFGKIRVHTGGGIFSKIKNRLLEVVARHFRTQIRQLVNERLEAYAKKAVSQVNFAALFR